MPRRQSGFSLLELLIAVAIIMIIGAIAIPNIRLAMLASRETAAMQEMRNLIAGQTQYMATHQRYATTLAELGPPPQGAGVVAEDVAEGVKSGYRFSLTRTADGFAVRATPLRPGETGKRSFFADETGVLRHNWGGEPATASSDPVSKPNPRKGT